MDDICNFGGLDDDNISCLVYGHTTLRKVVLEEPTSHV